MSGSSLSSHRNEKSSETSSHNHSSIGKEGIKKSVTIPVKESAANGTAVIDKKPARLSVAVTLEASDLVVKPVKRNSLSKVDGS